MEIGTMRGRKGEGLAPKAACCALALALAAASALPAQATHEQGKIDRPRTVVSAEDVALYPPAGGEASFAFLPDARFQPFDRTVALSSAPGEARSYLVTVVAGPGAEPETTAYIVDKRRPRAPRADPPSGLYYEGIAPELWSDAGATIMW